MDFLTAYAIYATGAILFVGMFAARVPREDVRTVFILGLIWPVSVISILFMVVLNAIKWDVNVETSTKVFGFRRPTNPKVKGFAITAFKVEIQFFKSA